MEKKTNLRLCPDTPHLNVNNSRTKYVMANFALYVCFKYPSKGCVQISSYFDEKQKSFIGFSVRIVNFEKTNSKGLEIRDDTFQILYGGLKIGSTKSGFSTPNR